MEEIILAEKLIERAEKLPSIKTYLSDDNLEYKNEEGRSIPVQVLFSGNELGVIICDMPPGRFAPHNHEKEIEFGTIFDGDGRAVVEFENGEKEEFQKGDVFRFKKNIKHTWNNDGYCRVLFITVPKEKGYP